MREPVYRITAAARSLDISLHHLRRLCEAGLVEADRTEGGQWRVPLTEVDRLKRQGVPPIPAPDPESPAPEVTSAALGDPDEPPPPEPLQEDPEVRSERVKRYAVSNRLARRKTELELAEVEDRFRDRERQARAEREAERHRQEQDTKRARKETWARELIAGVLKGMGSDGLAEYRPKVADAVRAALQNCGPDDSPSTVAAVIAGARESVLKPYRLQQRKEEAIRQAFNDLPLGAKNFWGAESKYQLAVRKTARVLFEELGDAPESAFCAAAHQAAQAVAKLYERDREEKRLADHREDILRRLDSWQFVKCTSRERTAAKESVARALVALQPLTPAEDLDQAAQRALKPHERALAQRLKRDELAEAGLRHFKKALDSYEFKWHSDKAEAFNTLRPELETELTAAIEDGDVEDSNVQEWVEDWVSDHIETEDED